MTTENYNTLSSNDKWRKAIISLKPGAKWTARDQALTWQDSGQTEPTASEIAAEITRLEGVATSEEYKRKRDVDYPSIEDQFDLIYHSGIDAWKAKIKETKDKYPKP